MTNKKEKFEIKTNGINRWKVKPIYTGMLNINKENCIEVMTRDIECPTLLKWTHKRIKNSQVKPIYFHPLEGTSIRMLNGEFGVDNEKYYMRIEIFRDSRDSRDTRTYTTELMELLKHPGFCHVPIEVEFDNHAEDIEMHETLLTKIYDELVNCFECDEYRSKSIFGNKNKLIDYCYDVEPVDANQ